MRHARPLLTRVLCGAWLLALAACETPSPVRPPTPCEAMRDQGPSVRATDAFSVVVMPDTQFYAERYPDIFQSQTRWIADHARDHRIAFVLHEGDIVNHNVAPEWDVASTALHALDNVVPYALTAGNHDVVIGPTGLTRDVDFFDEHFPVAMHDDHTWFCGAYEDDLQNSYALIEGGGRHWLVLALEFGPRDEVLSWANDILADYATFPAILVTHAYMYLGQARYDVRDATQQFSPHAYGIAGSVNDGEAMWNALVEPNPNVQLVLSGHMLWPGVGRLSSARADGSVTHQLLANYQTCPTADPCMHPDSDEMYRGGNGFLRVLDFNADHTRVDISTYSPHLDQAKSDADNQFGIALTLP